MLVTSQALKSVLPVEDSFSNKEMGTFSPIRAHQSTSETFNRHGRDLVGDTGNVSPHFF